MFTGIITGIGHITQVQSMGAAPHAGAVDTTGATYQSCGLRLHVQAPVGYLDDVAVGDSIAINGACMTVVEYDAADSQFLVDVSAESLARTVGLAQPGPVNLEKALRPVDRLGGHMVSGHVDGTGRVTHFARTGESHALHIAAPAELARFLAYKGSVVVNGVSLTVNQVVDYAPLSADAEADTKDRGCTIHINLIPHTVQHTTLHTLQVGDAVNLEVDLVARYVERMLGMQAVHGSLCTPPAQTTWQTGVPSASQAEQGTAPDTSTPPAP